MAVLKKGSKGKPVEDLQTQLNKLGSKPALKVDGIFGPLTDKALRAAQKRLKLDTADGKAGDMTVAALKYGKPLPKMEVPNVEKRLLAFEGVYRDIQKLEQQSKAIDTDIKAVIAAVQTMNSALAVAISSDLPNWTRAIEKKRKIHDAQTKFDKALLKNPAEAAKLAREALKLQQDLATEMQHLARTAAGVGQLMGDARKALVTGAKAIESASLDVEKRYVGTLSKMS